MRERTTQASGRRDSRRAGWEPPPEIARDALLRRIVAVAAAIVSPGEDQRVHCARHPHVAETPLLFQFLRIHQRARVREEALFQAGEEDQRELQALGGVQGHERDARVGVELVGVRCQCGVIEEVGEGFAADLGIVRRIGEFLQVFNPAEGLGRSFGFESLDVAGAIDDEADQLGKCGGIAGFAKGFCSSQTKSPSQIRNSLHVSPAIPWDPILPRGETWDSQSMLELRLDSFGIFRNGRTGFSAKGEKWLGSSSEI